MDGWACLAASFLYELFRFFGSPLRVSWIFDASSHMATKVSCLSGWWSWSPSIRGWMDGWTGRQAPVSFPTLAPLPSKEIYLRRASLLLFLRRGIIPLVFFCFEVAFLFSLLSILFLSPFPASSGLFIIHRLRLLGRVNHHCWSDER